LPEEELPEERHQKLLELADKLEAFADLHPEHAKLVDPILEFIGKELKEGSPLSAKCIAAIEEFEKSPESVCGDFRKTLSVSMCKAWKGIEEGKYKSMSEAMRSERGETFAKCRLLHKPSS
jgi:hypothetical protein